MWVQLGHPQIQWDTSVAMVKDARKLVDPGYLSLITNNTELITIQAVARPQGICIPIDTYIPQMSSHTC